MRQLTTNYLKGLQGGREPPCISLYQTTHRHHPDNRQDPIRYRNLRNDIETSLRERYPTRDVRALMAKYDALERDAQFWNHRTDGLAILSSPATFEILELQRPVQELLIVANTFYTKPLVRILQSADRYQVLCLSRGEARLYEGNRDALDPVDLQDSPSTLVARDDDEGAAHPYLVQDAASNGVACYRAVQKAGDTVVDRDGFFRAVDRAILEHHSRPSGLPLILVALTENQAPFRAVSHNPFLLAHGVEINAESLSIDELRAIAWQSLEPTYLRRLQDLLDRYHAAQSRQLASSDLVQVAHAAVFGRISTLLVQADRQIPGRIDAQTGELEPGDLADAQIGDVLNDLAETVLRLKGEVVVIPAERMPSGSGVAATYRF